MASPAASGLVAVVPPSPVGGLFANFAWLFRASGWVGLLIRVWRTVFSC